jgi:AraC-like DNA-binding protein
MCGNAKLDIILEYIDNNLDKPLTVNLLAEVLDFHPIHFQRLFKEKTGKTPAVYVNALKMEKAKWYLDNSDMNISKIMTKVGEKDLSCFDKKFKRFYAVSPTEYRKLNSQRQEMTV